MPTCCDRHFSHITQQRIKRWLIPGIIILAVLASVLIIVLHFVVTPQVTAKVEDARLDAFGFATRQSGGATTSYFIYNISVALGIRNPNRAMSIRYTRPLVATFLFHDRRLRNLTVVDKGYTQRRPGKTKVHLLHADGEVPSFLLGAGAAEDFKKQNATGQFKVEVRLSGEITYQGILVAKKSQLSMSCPLGLQLAPPGPAVIAFHVVHCNPVEEDKTYF